MNATPETDTVDVLAARADTPAAEHGVFLDSAGSSLPVSLKSTDDPSTKLARISYPNLLYGRNLLIGFVISWLLLLLARRTFNRLQADFAEDL